MKSKKRGTVIVSGLFAVLCLAQTASAFYAPNLQRWVNRDPIGIRGGMNLYRIIHNDTVNEIDLLGLLIADRWREINIREGQPCNSAPCKISNFKMQQDKTQKVSADTLVAAATYEMGGDCENIEIRWWSCTAQAIWNNNNGYDPRDGTAPTHWSDPMNPYPQSGNANPGVQITHAKMEYLSCEGGLWTKKSMDAPGTLIMHTDDWDYGDRPRRRPPSGGIYRGSDY